MRPLNGWALVNEAQHTWKLFKLFFTVWCKGCRRCSLLLLTGKIQCLLVKGWKGSSWSFPRGKKSKDEEDHACAIREVILILFDFSHRIFSILMSCKYYLDCNCKIHLKFNELVVRCYSISICRIWPRKTESWFDDLYIDVEKFLCYCQLFQTLITCWQLFNHLLHLL